MGPGPSQIVWTEEVPRYGPEPVGAMQAGILEASSVAGAQGRLNPVGQNRGPKGDPTRTANGDLGPLQSFTAVRTVAGPGAIGPSNTALPSTSGPASGSIQDRLGALGL